MADRDGDLFGGSESMEGRAGADERGRHGFHPYDEERRDDVARPYDDERSGG